MTRALTRIALLATIAAATLAAAPSGATDEAATANGTAQPTGSKLMYTTYFYTAGEAIVHGYEDDTSVRILSMATSQPVWTGTVGAGQTVTVPTGPGTFGFLSDKKASILVGTPSSCTVVGYWLRDEDGEHRSRHFYAQLPAGQGGSTDRLVVWGVGEPTQVTIRDLTTGSTVHTGKVSPGQRFEIPKGQLDGLRSHVLDIRAASDEVMVQVYQDEGFTVPATSGAGMGREFVTFVGDITNGVNDLNVVSYYGEATVNVIDIDTEEVIWHGTIPSGSVHTLTMANRYVRVTSDQQVQVIVAPFAHYTGQYAEHHFGMGIEGGAIDTDFMLPTTTELWVFSYYADNHVSVVDIESGETVWAGDMVAGSVTGLKPGHGFYRVRSNHGISVMGGALSCGAEYSPAGGMFKVDEALLAAVIEIREQRQAEAAKEGKVLSHDEIYAPLSDVELEYATQSVRSKTGNAAYSAPEAQQRLDSMVTEEE